MELGKHSWAFFALCGLIIALADSPASADEVKNDQGQVDLAETSGPQRWRFSAGARFAPNVKAKAHISSEAVVERAGRLPGSRSNSGKSAPKSGSQTSTRSHSSASSSQTSDKLPVTDSSRFEFDNGFVDMTDDAGIAGETSNWHFDDSSVFDETRGTITVQSSSSTRSQESQRKETSREATFASSRSTFSETVMPDIRSCGDKDIWGGDFEIGYDFYVGGPFMLGIGLGATFYKCENAIKAAGRCYSAVATERKEITRGRFVEVTETRTETTTSTKETTTFTDSNLAYDGATADISNDDGSIGAGTTDGYTNPHGGNNPVLTIGDSGAVQSQDTETKTSQTVTTTKGFINEGTSTKTVRKTRTIDIATEGDIETQEMRLALQPVWQSTSWLGFRGSLGAVATRISVEADTDVFVNGQRTFRDSGDDSGWVLCGLCGLDAIISPCDWFSLFIGADLRLGNTKMDYDAGLAKGEVELARHTFHAGVAVSF